METKGKHTPQEQPQWGLGYEKKPKVSSLSLLYCLLSICFILLSLCKLTLFDIENQCQPNLPTHNIYGQMGENSLCSNHV